MKKILINLLITLVFGFIYYYLILPPINIHSGSFWIFIIILLMIYFFLSLFNDFDFKKIHKNDFKKPGIISIIIIVIIGFIAVANIVCSPLFNSKSYSKRILIDENGTFDKDITLVDFNSLPLLDKASSQKLGDRVMGQMPELVSQFDVSDLYTQINYNNEIIRVTPLEYNDIFKYLANKKEGVKGYITVNSVTGESKLVKLDKGMKYVPSAILSKDLDRKLRFSYPTKIFGDKSFEIDNEGNPYWIVPTLTYTAVGLKEEVEGIVILDPITGDSKYYKVGEIPTWVDHVYNPNLIIEQVDNWGLYKNGFLNSIFGQKGVVATTDGYNYLVMNDDVYLYTGITSVVTDESNLGFILTNLRTKETKFYSVPGAEEYSAMASAEGQVQQMNYVASFPLLINLNGKPTYLMSLKDNAGLVKMYAFVDVVDYQKVTVTDSSLGIEKAAKNYLGSEVIDSSNKIEKKIKISSITSAMIDGNSYYYIVDTNNKKYRVSIDVNEKLIPFIKVGNSIKISYTSEDEVTEILNLNM